MMSKDVIVTNVWAILTMQSNYHPVNNFYLMGTVIIHSIGPPCRYGVPGIAMAAPLLSLHNNIHSTTILISQEAINL